eukprot:1115295-Pyramimonas_sp.AAC.2
MSRASASSSRGLRRRGGHGEASVRPQPSTRVSIPTHLSTSLTSSLRPSTWSCRCAYHRPVPSAQPASEATQSGRVETRPSWLRLLRADGRGGRIYP